MSRHVVVTDIARADAVAVKRLGAAGVATVHEAAGRRGLLDPCIRPIAPGMSVAGTAVTVLSPPGDNLMIHLAVECLRDGDVLVIATTSRSTDGMIGELLATSMQVHGARGVVTDAGVRDVRELTEMGFPVWARAVSAQGTVKASPGSVNVPVVCAGQLVHPGDAIVADDDGVACIPAADVRVVADAAEARVAKEDETRAKLGRGELGADLYDLRAQARELGIVYVEHVDDLDGPGSTQRGET